MSSNTSQQKTDGRNLFFTIGGLVVVLLIFAIFFEKKSGTLAPKVIVESQMVEKPLVIKKTTVIPKTTVNIQSM